MAQQTFNVQGMGNIPMFALETTAQRIADASDDMNRSLSFLQAIAAGDKSQLEYLKRSSHLTKSTNKSIHDMHHVGIAGLNKSFLYGTNLITTSLGKKLGELTNLSKGMDRMGNLFKPTAGGGVFDSLTKRLGINAASGELNAFGKILGKIGPIASLVGTGIGAILGVAETYRKNLIDLTNYGTGFGTSMLELETRLGSAGVTMDDYILVMQENGAAVRNLGTNATDASIQFTNLARDVRDTAKEFGAYGLTSQELNQFTGQYLEMQRRQGITGHDAAIGVQEAFQSLALQTDAVARQTGRDRREAMRAGMAAAGDRGVQRRAAVLGGERGAAVTEGAASLASVTASTFGEEFAPMWIKAAQESIAKGGVGLAQTSLRDMVPYLGEAAPMFDDLLQGIADGKLTPAQITEQFQEFGTTFKNLNKGWDQVGMQFVAEQKPMVQALIDAQTDFVAIKDIGSAIKSYQIETEEQGKRVTKATEAHANDLQKLLGAYEPMMKDLEGTLYGVRAKFIDYIMPSLDGFGTTLVGTTATIRDWALGTDTGGGKNTASWSDFTGMSFDQGKDLLDKVETISVGIRDTSELQRKNNEILSKINRGGPGDNLTKKTYGPQ